MECGKAESVKNQEMFSLITYGDHKKKKKDCGGSKKLWAGEEHTSTLIAPQLNLHVRLRRHLQTCQNTVHIRIQILVLHTLLVDVKALPRLAT